MLKDSDYSTASLNLTKFSDDRKTNINKNLENVMFLKA